MLRAASFANLSAISLPCVPVWDLTRENFILHSFLSRLATFFLISSMRNEWLFGLWSYARWDPTVHSFLWTHMYRRAWRWHVYRSKHVAHRCKQKTLLCLTYQCYNLLALFSLLSTILPPTGMYQKPIKDVNGESFLFLPSPLIEPSINSIRQFRIAALYFDGRHHDVLANT